VAGDEVRLRATAGAIAFLLLAPFIGLGLALWAWSTAIFGWPKRWL